MSTINSLDIADPLNTEEAERLYARLVSYTSMSRLMSFLRWIELGKTYEDLIIRAIFNPRKVSK